MSTGIVILFVILGIFYFIPTILAFKKGSEHRWIIFLINLVFGLSGIGWFFALYQAMKSKNES